MLVIDAFSKKCPQLYEISEMQIIWSRWWRDRDERFFKTKILFFGNCAFVFWLKYLTIAWRPVPWDCVRTLFTRPRTLSNVYQSKNEYSLNISHDTPSWKTADQRYSVDIISVPKTCFLIKMVASQNRWPSFSRTPSHRNCRRACDRHCILGVLVLTNVHNL